MQGVPLLPRSDGGGRAAVCRAALFSILLAGNGGGLEPARGRPAGTERMAQRLAELAEPILQDSPYFDAAARIARLRRSVPEADPRQQVAHQLELARALLDQGETGEAVERLRSVRERLARDPELLPGSWLDQTRELLAIASLRLGEQQNCIQRHQAESCLLPIQGGGIHARREGSRAAVEAYSEILVQHPDDLTSRWLLNIASMTLGTYPDGVPPQWRIAPETFRSDYPLERFPNIAPRLGVNVIGLAGGSILEDFDGDGHLDLMVSSWGPRDPLRYFRNQGDGHFGERTEAAGLSGLVGGLNLLQADYDNDGDADVLVLRGAWLGGLGKLPNSLLRNDGAGRFEDVTEAAGLLDFHPTQTAGFADFDGDGNLDLFIGNETHGPDEVHPCQLWRNRGDGTFTDVARSAGVAVVGFVKGVTWTDYNGDGWPDLYLSRMLQTNLLFRNNGRAEGGQVTFTEVSRTAGVSDPVRSFPTWSFDYDNDGWLDLFVSGYSASYLEATAADTVADILGRPSHGETPRLYRNRGDGTFADVTREAGLDRVLLTMGCNFGDLDNDGFLDFYLGTGAPDYRILVPNKMYRNAAGGRFQDVTSAGGFGHLQKGHAISFGDIDGDGDQDIYAVMGGALPGDVFQNVLFENPGNANHWVTLRLEGVRSNRAAIGARLRLRVAEPQGQRDIYATVGSGGSFGASSLQQEIGIGAATAILELEIRWPPPGQSQSFHNLPLDRVIRLREGDPKPSYPEAPSPRPADPAG